MKASLKFRDEQKPLFRAKVPLSILGLPFQSGIVGGESKELTLSVATFFESGPSIKVAYRPNDAWNPFSLVVKTGTGPFGSPTSSSMLMSAEFNLLGRSNPTFMLHFKPQFGDFSIKKSHSSVFEKKLKSAEDDSSVEVVDSPPAVNGGGATFSAVNGGVGVFSAARKITVLPSPAAVDLAGLFSGMEVGARTELPVRGRAVVNFRWGVRIPAEMRSGNPISGISFRKIPFLVMNKIGIEHVDGSDSKETKTQKKAGSNSGFSGNADVAETCVTVKRQLEVLQAENGSLKQAVEELRREIAGGKSTPFTGESNPGRYREIEGNGSKARMERKNNEKRSMEGEMNEELKKALK